MRTTAIALIMTLGTWGLGLGTWGTTLYASSAEAATAAKVEQEASSWHKVAESIPLGSKVKVQTNDGKRVSGTLMRADDTAVTIKKNTRMPEAAVIVNYDAIANLEHDHGSGISWAKAIGIGAAVGVGAIMTIFVIALQLD